MVVALPPVRLSSAALAESSLRSRRKREVTMEVRLDRMMRYVVQRMRRQVVSQEGEFELYHSCVHNELGVSYKTEQRAYDLDGEWSFTTLNEPT